MDGLTLLRPGEPATGNTAEEKERRRASIDYARTSIQLEDLVSSTFSDEITRLDVQGKTARAELTAAIQAYHGL